MTRLGGVTLGTLAFVMLSVGCVPKPTHSGFLTDYSQLKKDGSTELKYVKPDLHLAGKDKIIIDPITAHMDPAAEQKVVDPTELKNLTDRFQKAVSEELRTRYDIVTEPGDGVLRLRIAITQLKPGNPIMHGVTGVVPVGLAVTTVENLATGTYMAAGEATIEAELVDSQTGERLAAIVDVKAGQRYQLVAGFTKWGEVEGFFESWAKNLGKSLDEHQ